MPTGYTSKIYDNKNQSFEDFVLCCARAFGACIMQKDDNMDEPPKLQEEDSYHLEGLARAQKELAKFNNTPKKEFRDEFNKYVSEQRKYNQKSILEKEKLQKRYELMLTKVEKWNPPTEDHKGLKDFMTRQLRESIEFDCGGDYYVRSNKELDNLTFDKWYNDKKDSVNRDLEYHAAEYKKETKKTNNFNKWIIDLYKSLGKNTK